MQGMGCPKQKNGSHAVFLFGEIVPVSCLFQSSLDLPGAEVQ